MNNESASIVELEGMGLQEIHDELQQEREAGEYTVSRELHIEIGGVYVTVEMTMFLLRGLQTWQTYSETPMKFSNLNGDDDGYLFYRDEHGSYVSVIVLPIDVIPLIVAGHDQEVQG